MIPEGFPGFPAAPGAISRCPRSPGRTQQALGGPRFVSMIPERLRALRLGCFRRAPAEVASHGAPPDVTSVRGGRRLRRERRLERLDGTAPCPRRHRSTGTSWRSRWGTNPWGAWPGSGTCWAGNWRRRALTRRTWCWGSSWCCARTRSCSGSGSRRRAGPTPNRAGTARAACASGATPSSEPPPQKTAPRAPPLSPLPKKQHPGPLL